MNIEFARRFFWGARSVEQYGSVNFGGFAIFKIVVTLFHLLPYLALSISR